MNIRLWLAATVLIAASGTTPAQIYVATLIGAAENPANASPATGSTVVTINSGASTMQVDVEFSGLSGPNTAAHIHCCTTPPMNIGVATVTPTFTGFPSGVTSGTYSNVFDMTMTSSFNAPYVTANGGTAATAFAALSAGIANGQAYLNVHSSVFPAGEIRNFLVKRDIFVDGFDSP